MRFSDNLGTNVSCQKQQKVSVCTVATAIEPLQYTNIHHVKDYYLQSINKMTYFI